MAWTGLLSQTHAMAVLSPRDILTDLLEVL